MSCARLVCHHRSRCNSLCCLSRLVPASSRVLKDKFLAGCPPQPVEWVGRAVQLPVAAAQAAGGAHCNARGAVQQQEGSHNRVSGCFNDPEVLRYMFSTDLLSLVPLEDLHAAEIRGLLSWQDCQHYGKRASTGHPVSVHSGPSSGLWVASSAPSSRAAIQ
jgi:hypothetical protein